MTRIATLAIICTAACSGAAMTAAGVASAEPPEFGRCVKVATGTGVYATAKCTAEGGEKKWVWLPGPGAKAKFKESVTGEKAFKWKLATRDEGVCSAENATGEYTGAKTVAHVHLTFTGCGLIAGTTAEPIKVPCENIVLAPMAGELGVYLVGEMPEKDKLGLKLAPEEGEALASFACQGFEPPPFAWRGGSVIANFPANAMLLTTTLAYKQKHGPLGSGEENQIPASFVGEASDPLESTGPFGGANNERYFVAMGWQMSTKLTGEEKIEANSVR